MNVRELIIYLNRRDDEDSVALTIDDMDYSIDSVSHNGTDTVLILAGDIVG